MEQSVVKRSTPKLRPGTGRAVTNRPFGFRKRVHEVPELSCIPTKAAAIVLIVVDEPPKVEYLRGRRTGIIIKANNIPRDEDGLEFVKAFWEAEVIDIGTDELGNSDKEMPEIDANRLESLRSSVAGRPSASSSRSEQDQSGSSYCLSELPSGVSRINAGGSATSGDSRSDRSSSVSHISAPRMSCATARTSVISIAGEPMDSFFSDEQETRRDSQASDVRSHGSASTLDETADKQTLGETTLEGSSLEATVLEDEYENGSVGGGLEESEQEESIVSDPCSISRSRTSGASMVEHEDDEAESDHNMTTNQTAASESASAPTSMERSRSSNGFDLSSPDPDASKKLTFNEPDSSGKKQRQSLLDAVPEVLAPDQDGEDLALPEGKPPAAVKKQSRPKPPGRLPERLETMGRASYCTTDSYAPKSSRLSLLAPRPVVDDAVETRQSSRRRIPPLQYWRNERVEYARASGAAVPEIVDLVVVEPESTPKWARRRQGKPAQQASSADNKEPADDENAESDLSAKPTKRKARRPPRDDDDEPSKKKKKSKARRGDSGSEDAAPAHKKRSAFFLFCDEKRSEARALHPGLTVTELAKEMAIMWKALSSEERQPFRDAAA